MSRVGVCCRAKEVVEGGMELSLIVGKLNVLGVWVGLLCLVVCCMKPTDVRGGEVLLLVI